MSPYAHGVMLEDPYCVLYVTFRTFLTIDVYEYWQEGGNANFAVAVRFHKQGYGYKVLDK
jgi:hypothetical protein